ncbi:UNVERIFIED_CONTAM: signal transduction histidine kinase [Acetivibrio alkalicellulosi]
MLLASFFIDIMGVLIFLAIGGKNKENYCLCLIIFCSACTSLTEYFKNIISYDNYINAFFNIHLYFYKINEFLYSFFHYIFWFACFTFAIYYFQLYWSIFKKNEKKILILSFLLPLTASIFISGYTQNKTQVLIITIMAIMYYLLSNILIFYKYTHVVSIEHKNLYWVKLLYFFLKTTYVVLVNHVLYSFGMIDLWNIGVFIGVLHMILFLYLFIFYGLQYYRLKIYNYEINTAINAIKLSTAFINHTIKNEVNKLFLYTDLIGDNFKLTNKLPFDYLNVIKQSSGHLLEMSKRIDTNLKDISVEIKQNNIYQIVETAIKMTEKYKSNKKISIINNIQEQMIYCDEFHIKELLINIFKNSIESIKNEGTINISCVTNCKTYILKIEDDGSGITKEHLNHILKPFYSTKDSCANYGIGLTYCYNVIKKHKGSIQIISNGIKGCTVILSFPILSKYFNGSDLIDKSSNY